jgi:pimeloyl-ACP methyl ester carboxylesterase
MPDHRMDIYARPQQLVKIGRRRQLNVHITGEGSPTVILSAGGGCTTLHWALVQPMLSATNRVFAFDRAGLGFSDPGPVPRTTSRSLGDLRGALKVTGTEPPYVLVGHSMGSFDMQLFAFQHPEEVVGMVLVDPRGDRVFERLAVAAPSMKGGGERNRRQFRRNAVIASRRPQPGSAEYEALAAPPEPQLTDAVNAALRDATLRPSTWRTFASEGANLDGASMDQLDAARRHLGSLPLIVLTAANAASMFGLSPQETEAAKRVWEATHEELARLSDRGVRREVADCGHMIQVERPDVVVAAIREVIAAAA